ncbi:hypothetical protein HGB48_24935 [Actinomadura latina]|uniref:Uncharacterized protein n=1 Tax=Actinomadura latina TaxID=163603 RepID=A0A846Z221_9ACTN|nr:hypothetical protein [Actinomadura latina]
MFAVLAGLELIAIPLAPMPLVVHQGMAGVASWLIGALLVTAGVLMWAQPAQRSFYGILAVLLSLASFLTSNFGGFFVGLLLGLIGGALGFAWSPAPAPAPGPDPTAAPDPGATIPDASSPHRERGRPGAHAAPRGGHLTAIALPALLGFHLLSPTPAPSPPASPTPAPSPTRTPSPAPTTTPAPSATPTPTAPACPDVPANGSGLSQAEARKLLQELTSSKDPACAPKSKAAASGTRVYSDSGTLRADSLTMSGLRYDGVAPLASAAGTVKALKFSMSKAVLENVDQTSAHGAATVRIRTPSLTLTGDVVMYTTKMSSKLLGIPLTFTPEHPPPLTLPYMVMTDVVSEQPTVTANGAQLAGLGIADA